MNIKNEIIDAIETIVDSVVKRVCPNILFGVVTDIDLPNKKCTTLINNVDYIIRYYGAEPIVNQKYPVFIPFNKMNLAFIIGDKPYEFKHEEYIYYIDSEATEGYVKMATIKINQSYADAPITIMFSRRGDETANYVNILFNSDASLDPTIRKFSYSGFCSAVYLYKKNTSIWEIWVQKVEPYDRICVLDYWKSHYMEKVEILFETEFSASAKSGWTAASKQSW